MNSLEIFSGAGGLARGLEDAGFFHSAFVELNKHACSSLRENFAPENIFEGDIRNFDVSQLRRIDVVAGGPPCQPFSLGGQHKAHADHRDMFPYAIHAIEKLLPKAFIFENVKGLLRPSFSDYFDYIILRLTYPGAKIAKDEDWQTHLEHLKTLQSVPYAGFKYNVQFKLLNAADYGVPQTRERVFMVGIRSDLDIDWSFPEPTHSEDRLLWDMHVTGEYWKRHSIRPSHDAKGEQCSHYGMFAPDTLPWQTIRDVLVDVPEPQSRHGIPDHVFRDGARSYAGHTGSFIDWPAKTIKAGSHGVPGGENMIRYADGSARYFTVFEAKKIQTFPDDFKVLGAWGEAMRQIGNAVPVQLAAALGKQLMEALQGITPKVKQRA